jgi:hypothetical protein
MVVIQHVTTVHLKNTMKGCFQVMAILFNVNKACTATCQTLGWLPQANFHFRSH